MGKNKNFKTLMSYAGKHRVLTYLSWLLSGVSALLALMPFVFIWLIIKEVLEVMPDFSRTTDIVFNGFMAVMFALLSMIVYFGGLMCSHLSAFRVAGNIRKKTLKHITKLPLGTVSELGSGRLRRIINESSGATETYLAHQLPDFAGAVATPLGMIVILFLFDWMLGLLSLIPTLLAFLIMMRMTGKRMAEKMKQYQGALEEMNNEAVEYVRGIPVVKTFGQTVFSFKRFKGSIDKYNTWVVAYTKDLRMPMMIYTTVINGVFAILISVALIVAGRNVVDPTFLLNLIFYIVFTPIISVTMTKIMYMSENGMIVNDALERVNSILSIEPLADPVIPKSASGNSVEFDNVTFRYKNSDTDALKDISFTAYAGKTVALVGPSGGGKTTAAGLISRFWDVTYGEVKVGGVNVKDMNKEELMRTVSYVFQDSRLLKMSIFENVRLSRPDTSREEVMSALHNAQCDDIIAKLPNGVDTVIGTKGVYLSGGEQQRIAIARVMLKDAPIIVLDEATAFTDPENEVMVQKAFKQLAKEKTVIMIAHRLTTVKSADCIYVMREGRIEECGTHDELIKANNIYSKMWSEYQTAVNWKLGGTV